MYVFIIYFISNITIKPYMIKCKRESMFIIPILKLSAKYKSKLMYFYFRNISTNGHI